MSDQIIPDKFNIKSPFSERRISDFADDDRGDSDMELCAWYAHTQISLYDWHKQVFRENDGEFKYKIEHEDENGVVVQTHPMPNLLDYEHDDTFGRIDDLMSDEGSIYWNFSPTWGMYSNYGFFDGVFLFSSDLLKLVLIMKILQTHFREHLPQDERF